MSEQIYINCAKNSKVKDRQVKIKDVATIWCSNENITKQIKQATILEIDTNKKARFCLTVMDIFDVINKLCPDAVIDSIGENELIIDYVPKKPSAIIEWVKAICVGIVTFVGSIYAIMAYNNDVGIKDIFNHIYSIFEGADRGVLELCYSIGIFLGIVIFYNHAGRLRLTNDPTPLEVQMRTYENQLDDAILKNNDRGPH